jgi:hypothetical protein
MSDKRFEKLNVIDQQIRRTLHMGNQENGTYLTIEFIHGFELFNTRPYHNYETWSQGYRITDPQIMDTRWGRKGDKPLVIEAEDLDDAIRNWMAERAKAEAKQEEEAKA